MRHAVANSVKSLTGLNLDQVDIVTGTEPRSLTAAGESAALTAWVYKKDKREKIPQNFASYCQTESDLFNRGLVLGQAQNLARDLMELPSNLLTPKLFSKRIVEELAELGVKVNVYGADWIREQNMNAFWSVAKGHLG